MSEVDPRIESLPKTGTEYHDAVRAGEIEEVKSWISACWPGSWFNFVVRVDGDLFISGYGVGEDSSDSWMGLEWHPAEEHTVVTYRRAKRV